MVATLQHPHLTPQEYLHLSPVRTKQGVMLTEAGQAFLDEARLTLAQAERAVKAARQAIEGHKQLVIAFSICAFNHVLPDIIQAFRLLKNLFPCWKLRQLGDEDNPLKS